jgi:hypothetical protein
LKISDRHVVLPPLDGVFLNFKLSLDFSENRDRFYNAAKEIIKEKVELSLVPDLTAFSFDRVPQGWKNTKRDTHKPFANLLVVPPYAQLNEQRQFAYILASSSTTLQSFRYIFGIAFEEVVIDA